MAAPLLPDDIVLAILPFLEPAELKQTRLCNRLLASKSAKWLFETLNILYLRRDLDRLRIIAKHDKLRLYVRRIVFVGDRFPPNLSMDQWRHHYNKERHAQMNSLVWLRHPYEEYLRTSDEQLVRLARQ